MPKAPHMLAEPCNGLQYSNPTDNFCISHTKLKKIKMCKTSDDSILPERRAWKLPYLLLPPNDKRKLPSPLIIKSTCLMAQQRLKGHLLWSRPSISRSLWLQFWPAAKAQENTRSKNRRFTIKKSQYLEAREAAKDNHNHIQKPDLDFFFLSFLTNLSRYEKIPTGLAVKLQFRKRANLLLSCPLKYIIRGQLSLSKVLPNPALVGDRPPLQSNSCSLLKRCQLVGRLLQNP